jgi:signal transduction histidine kinase
MAQISWRWKVILPLVGMLLLGIFLLTYDALAVQRRELEQNMLREGEIYGLLAEHSLSGLLENPTASVEQLHERLSLLSDTMGAKLIILDADGNVLHSSAMEEEGRPTSPEIRALGRESRKRSPAIRRAGRYQMVAVSPVGPPALARVLAIELDESETLAMLDATRRHIIAVAATWMVLLTLVVMGVLRVLVHQPVLELRHKISRARRGDWRVSVGFADRRDEIGELGTDFNDMVRQLRENCQQCEHLHNIHLQQAAHLASIGELAAGLAHEIKNPLAGIAGAIDIIRDELPASDANRAILGEVQNECKRIKKTISDLLNYAMPQPPRLQTASLNQTLEHAVQMVEHQSDGKVVRVVRDLDTALPALPHDPDQIEQVVRNLLINARDAISGAGEIRVSTRFVPSPAANRAPAVELVVSDSGAGMTPEQTARIFRPFFTTKQSGSGLGLAVCKRIVDQHGGSISVESEVGRGSRFVIRLPVVPAAEKVFTLV